jgi:hypothetical protein
MEDALRNKEQKCRFLLFVPADKVRTEAEAGTKPVRGRDAMRRLSVLLSPTDRCQRMCLPVDRGQTREEEVVVRRRKGGWRRKRKAKRGELIEDE